MGRAFCCATAKSAGNRWREEGRRGRREGGKEGGQGGRGVGRKEGEEGEYGEEGGQRGRGGESGDEGGELCWIQPLQVSWHRLSVSSRGKGEQLSPTSALLLFYCFRLSPGLPFF